MFSSKILIYLFAVLSTFFAPIQTVMIAIIFLMTIDFTCGVIASYKRGESFTSAKMKNSIIKLFLYQLAIITGHLVALYFIPGIPWVNVVAGLIGATELRSIFENISNATGTNFVTKIKDLIAGYFNKGTSEDG